MFDLSMPWWEFALRAVAVYFVLLVLVRISGKRSVGQFTPFDMLLVILLGTSVQNSLIGDDISLLGGLLLAAVLIGLNYAVGWISARHPRINRLVEGEAILLGRDGEIFSERLRRECISEADFDEAMRRHGLYERSQIAFAWLETDGRIALLSRKERSE